eukprot:gene42859-56973_t
MRNGMRAGYSAEAHPFPSLFADKIYNIAGVTVTMQDIGTFALAMVIVLATQAFLAKTITGRAMQAVAQNTESATVLGINVPRMILYTFAINAVLAVAAALLVTPTYLAKFDMGEGLGTKAFFAAIIGGFNNSRGALLGGLIVGVCENLAAAYISPAYKDAVALIIFMVVILFKPQGLLGKKEERKGGALCGPAKPVPRLHWAKRTSVLMAVLGALLLCVAQELAVPLMGPSYKLVLSFVVLAVVLLVRPAGVRPMIAYLCAIGIVALIYCLLALGLILLDELDNAYGDVYSAAVSGNSLLSRVSVRAWGLAIALVCTGLALVLPMHALEPFLLMLSSVFIPLYGVILARLVGKANVAALVTERAVNYSAVLIWFSGVVFYHLMSKMAPAWGA